MLKINEHLRMPSDKRGPRVQQAGFTLVEMMVAVGLFAIVMIVCVSALLSLVNANRKAQALQSVINNLNIALDGIVREARMGSDFHCGAGAGQNMTPQDCSNGDTVFAFEPFGNTSSGNPWIYSYGVDSNGVGRIYRSTDGNPAIPITAPEVSIDKLDFYVVGTKRGQGDNTQPRVVIEVEGTAGAEGSAAHTTFHIQATAVQRLLDL